MSRNALVSSLMLVVVMLLATACSDDTPTEGPVTIVGQLDFSEQFGVGTFEVTEGADVLQCASGTFEDGFMSEVSFVRVFACESGSNEGTFTAAVAITSEPDPEGFVDGTWSSLAGSDDFVGLEGGGEYSAVVDPDAEKGVDTWTGDIKSGSDTSTSGLVTIETDSDFSADPVVGTFEVTEGADVLGCSSGTLENTRGDDGGVYKELTCESGSKDGSFTAVFFPDPETVGWAPWSISAGTGDFAGLRGGGNFWVVVVPDGSGHSVENLTGNIEYTS